ncbi:unnamed protein product, partial [Phaeothamnion confervicola]
SHAELGKRKNRWGEDSAGGGPVADPVATAAAVAAALGVGAAPKEVKKQKKIYVPDTPPDINFAGIIIGPRGSALKEMQERTGARIIIRGRGSQKLCLQASYEPQHVVLEGGDAAIEAAEREINAIFSNPAHAMQLKQQQLQTLNDINNSSSGGGGVHYGGPPAHYGALPPPPAGADGAATADEIVVQLNVSNALVGSIIGRAGENVQRMQRDFAISVQIGRASDMQPGQTDRPVTLRGPRPAVEACKAHIEAILSEKERGGGGYVNPAPGGAPPAPGPGYGAGGGGGGSHYGPGTAGGAGGGSGDDGGSSTVQVPVPNDKVGLVIGKGGGTIKGIQMRTGTNVQVPPAADADDPTRRTISVTGPSLDATDRAIAEIQNI